jgi:predicted ATP-grasp superfamily ATP-dependent carboligase
LDSVRARTPRAPGEAGAAANLPAVVLGGGVTGLSVARSLAAAQIPVYVLDQPKARARGSRAVTGYVDVGADRPQDRMLEWLNAADHEAVVLPASDDGVELVARHRAELTARGHRPIEANDDVLLAMLNKVQTYDLARRHGIAAPKIIRLVDEEGLEAALEHLEFPCVLKPDQSHVFAHRGGGGAKVLMIRDASELRRECARFSALGVEMFVTEVIYGESDEFVSYYGYLDADGENLVNFTKCKIRQCPPGFGIGTYHETTRDPEVAATGLRFLRAMGLRGLGNVEFKRDARDGRLVLIECNPRFTMSNELARIAGVDLALVCYNRALERPVAPIEDYRVGLHLWDPVRDVRALSTYRSSGELSAGSWAASLLHRQVFPTFRLDDPVPAVLRAAQMIRTASASRGVKDSAPSGESVPSTGASQGGRRPRATGLDRALDRLAADGGARGRAVAARVDLTRASGIGPLVRRVRSERLFSELGGQVRNRLYEGIWTDAAERCGAEIATLAPGLFELRRDDARTRVYQQHVSLDDSVTLQVALDKSVVHRLMAEAGVPDAEHLEWGFSELGRAAVFLAEATGPCVVKPAAGTGGGNGVVPGVLRFDDLLRARWHAGKGGDRLLIERQVEGDVYRLLLLDGELLDVVRSVPANVTGDGRSTVEELIKRENERRVAARGAAGLSLIGVNLDTMLTLRREGETLTSVLAPGRTLLLRVATNCNAERDNETWQGPVAESVIDDVRAAVRAVGLRLAGVDVITRDISRPLIETGGAVAEVNGGPGLHHHYLVADRAIASPVAVPVLEKLLGEEGQQDVSPDAAESARLTRSPAHSGLGEVPI